MKVSDLPDLIKQKDLLRTHKIRNGGLSDKPTGGGALWGTSKEEIFDLNILPELSKIELDEQMDIKIGATAKISTLINFLENMEDRDENTLKIANYLKQIGGTGIRNLGSVVGNILSAKKFTSDIYPLFMAMEQFHFQGFDENGDQGRCKHRPRIKCF